MPLYARTVTYHVPAASLEDAEEIWADDGPECAPRVEDVGSTEFKKIPNIYLPPTGH